MMRISVGVLLVACFVFAGCGGGGQAASTPDTDRSLLATETELPKAELKLDKLPKSTEEPKIKVSGIATPGARVAVKGRRVIAKSNGRFNLPVPLKVGRNELVVNAPRDGLRQAAREVTIRRVEPPAPEPDPAAVVPTEPPVRACPASRPGCPGYVPPTDGCPEGFYRARTGSSPGTCARNGYD